MGHVATLFHLKYEGDSVAEQAKWIKGKRLPKLRTCVLHSGNVSSTKKEKEICLIYFRMTKFRGYNLRADLFRFFLSKETGMRRRVLDFNRI